MDVVSSYEEIEWCSRRVVFKFIVRMRSCVYLYAHGSTYNVHEYLPVCTTYNVRRTLYVLHTRKNCVVVRKSKYISKH